MLRVAYSSYKYDNRKWWFCSKCGKRNTYFTKQNTECLSCGNKIPVISDLRINLNYRIKYYKNGELC